MAKTQYDPTFSKIFTGLHRVMYKLSRGRIGGKIEGGHIVILGTTGRKTRRKRESPLIALEHPTGWVVTASNSGHDYAPGWYHNLMANPLAKLRLGKHVHNVEARVTEGEERDELWNKLVAIHPDYAAYEEVTDRKIPVLVLERR